MNFKIKNRNIVSIKRSFYKYPEISEFQKEILKITVKAIAHGKLYSDPIISDYIELPSMFIEIGNSFISIKTTEGNEIYSEFPEQYIAKIKNQFYAKNSYIKSKLKAKYDTCSINRLKQLKEGIC